MASSSVIPLSFAPLPVRRLCLGKRAASPSSWTQGTGPFPDLASTPPKQRFTGGRGSSSLVERVELHRQKIAVEVPYRAEETSCLEILEQELKKKKNGLPRHGCRRCRACSHDRPCAVHCRQQFSVAQFVALFVLVGSNKNHFWFKSEETCQSQGSPLKRAWSL